MSDPIAARLKRACQDERDRADVGMRVGLPKVVVDVSSLEALLVRYAHKDERIAELEADNERLRRLALNGYELATLVQAEESEAERLREAIEAHRAETNEHDAKLWSALGDGA